MLTHEIQLYLRFLYSLRFFIQKSHFLSVLRLIPKTTLSIIEKRKQTKSKTDKMINTVKHLTVSAATVTSIFFGYTTPTHPKTPSRPPMERGTGRILLATVVTTSREDCKALGGTPISDDDKSDVIRCRLSSNFG